MWEEIRKFILSKILKNIITAQANVKDAVNVAPIFMSSISNMC